MFFTGLTPPTDVSYDVSNCITGLELVPSSKSFGVTNLQLCGTNFFLGLSFETQSVLLTFLNSSFNNIYGYNGTWSIINDHLIYTGSEECLGSNCLTLEVMNIWDGIFDIWDGTNDLIY